MTTPSDRMYAHRLGYHKRVGGAADPLCLLCHLQEKGIKGTVTAPGSLLRERSDRLGLPRDLREAGLVRDEDGAFTHPSQDQTEYDR